MALVRAYCTVSAVLADLRNSAVAIADVEAAIHASSRWIDEHTGRDWFLHDHSSTPLRLYGASRFVTEDSIHLPHNPVILWTSLSVDDELWTQGEDYEVIDGYSLIALESKFPTNRTAAFDIRAKFGYAETGTSTGVYAVPGYVERACVMLASSISGHLRKDVVGLDGNTTTVIDRNVPPAVLSLLGSQTARC